MKRDALDKSPFSFAGAQGVLPRQNKKPCRTETGKRICAQMFWGNAAQAESIDTEMR